MNLDLDLSVYFVLTQLKQVANSCDGLIWIWYRYISICRYILMVMDITTASSMALAVVPVGYKGNGSLHVISAHCKLNCNCTIIANCIS